MIQIKDPIITNNPKNTFKIVHDWMLGDSDGDTTSTQYIDKSDEKRLDRLLYCCSKFEKALPGTWANVLEKSTIKKCLSEEDYKWFMDNHEDLGFDIITEQGHTFVSYQGFSIKFYDENGTAHRCEWISTEDWRDKVITETLNG